MSLSMMTEQLAIENAKLRRELHKLRVCYDSSLKAEERWKNYYKDAEGENAELKAKLEIAKEVLIEIQLPAYKDTDADSLLITLSNRASNCLEKLK